MSSEPVKLAFKPYPHQRAAHVVLLAVRFLVLVWHRGAGKTVFSLMELVLAALRCKHQAGRYAYIAPYLKQAKGAAWDCLKVFARDIPGVVINESELYVQFLNGARVRIFGADNPDALRGLHWDGVVLDEVADMRPDVWFVILRPALSARNGWAIFIGTPKGVNLFSQIYYAALNTEGWHAEVRRANDTDVIAKDELARLKRTLSKSQYAQEMECDFGASVDDILVRLEDVLASQQRTARHEQFSFAPKILGVDVARYGDDLNVLQPRQGICAFTPKFVGGLDTMEVASRVALAIDKWKPDAVFIDAGGIGAGVLDRLRQLGYTVIGVDFGGKASEPRFENKRAEMWSSMADWVRDAGCLPDVLRLQADLTAPHFTYANARGRMQLESKDDMRARGLPSPDFGDSLALTFAYPVSAHDFRSEAKKRRAVKELDFDPFSDFGQTAPTRLNNDFDPFDERSL